MKKRDFFLSISIFLIWGHSSMLVSAFTSASEKKSDSIVLAGLVVFISLFCLSLQLISQKNRLLLRTFSKKEIPKLFLPAILGFYLYPMAYFQGIGGTQPLRANIMNYSWPLIAFVFSVFIRFIKKEKIKINLVDIISILFAVMGGWIVLSFNENISSIQSELDLKYTRTALLGAFSYGIYTALIEHFIPQNTSASNRDKILPSSLRMLVMVLISSLMYIPVFIWITAFSPERLVNTISNLMLNKIQLKYFILYSVFNFTIAHLLWIRLNSTVSIVFTSSTAFLTPLISTVILSRYMNMNIGFPVSIGLFMIVISITINNRKFVNSINATFAGILVSIILTCVTPFLSDSKSNETAKYFLEIIIALFSIYYGFLMNRIVMDYKEFEKLIDKIVVFKSKLPKNIRLEFEKIEEKIISKRTIFDNKRGLPSEFLLKKLPKSITEKQHEEATNYYFSLLRNRNYLLSISEWLVIIILSISIVSLCLFVRTSNLISHIFFVVICSALCLCVSSLYEYEKDKSKLMETLSKYKINNKQK